MSLLATLSSFFNTKSSNVDHLQITAEKVQCEEYPYLYQDDDFLEISTMSSSELKSEISSYNEDPDEILALIQGELDHKIIPIKKPIEATHSINFVGFLSQIIDKKIFSDAFNTPHKNNEFSLPLYSLFIISILAFLLIPPMVSTHHYAQKKEEETLKLSYQKIKEEITHLKEQYKIALTKIEQQKIQIASIDTTYRIPKRQAMVIDNETKIERNILSTINFNNTSEENERKYSLTNIYINKDSNIKPVHINNIQTADYKKSNNSFSTPNLLKTNTSLPDDVTVKITSGVNLYELTKQYDLSVRNWSVVNKLPILNEGNTLIMKTDGKYLIGVTYIKKDGSVIDYKITGGEIRPSNRIAYDEEVITLTGTIVGSLSKTIRNKKIFKNNPQIADIITQKAKWSLAKQSEFNFRKISNGTTYKIKVHVRKDKETKRIIYVGEIEEAILLMNEIIIARNTSI